MQGEDNEEALEKFRRSLLELEDRLLSIPVPISTVTKLTGANSFEVTTSKLNEIIDTVNILAAAVNTTRKNSF